MFRRTRKWMSEHKVLMIGYGTLVALIASAATGYTSHVAARQLNAAVAMSRVQIDALQQKSAEQDRALDRNHTHIVHLELHSATQDSQISEQRKAIHSLEQLRRQNLQSLTGLRDDLAARNVQDTVIAKRLHQLEKANQAAHAVISHAASKP